MLVTFDFDDTLLMTRPDEEWGVVEDGPNTLVIEKMRAFLDAGHEVHIVTTRKAAGEEQDDSEPTRTAVRPFLQEHRLLDRIAGIHFTDGVPKADTIKRLGSNKHFDDDDHEIDNLPKGCIGVHVLTPLWDL